MSFVAILGAGELGGALAQTLARRDRVAEIRLIDAAADVAAGKALDLQQAGPIERFGAVLRSSADEASAAGASAIVLADTAGSGVAQEERLQTDRGLSVLRRLFDLDDRAVVVCAGAGARDLIERGVRDLGIERRRLIGSAPGALASALRAMVALEARASPADVSLGVLGVPPSRFVVPWSDGSIGGVRLTSLLTPPALARLDARLASLWPPGPYALASAAARLVEAIVCGSDRRFACFVTLDGELGVRRRTVAAPVTVGAGGVRQVLTPALTVHERVQLDNAIVD